MNNSNTQELKQNYQFNKSTILNNVDIFSIEKSVKKSEQEISNGLGLNLNCAMAKIHKEVFGEEL